MGRLWLRRLLRWGGWTAVALLAVVVAAYAVLQTSPGLAGAARLAGWFASSPGFAVEIKGLGGTLPFDMRAERIEIADEKGVWLALDDARIDLSAVALLDRHAQIGTLGAGKIEIVRPPEPTGSPPPPAPLAESLRLPRLPVSLTVARLSVGRLVLDPPLLGERIEAALDGHVTQHGDDTDIALNLRRTDDKPGGLELQIRQNGLDPVLFLKIAATEPTGLLLNRVLARADNLPLDVSLTGEGKLAQWRGKLAVAAGQAARFAADISIAAARDTTVTLDGAAAFAPLLSPQMAAAFGNSVAVAAKATLKESGVAALDALSLRAAAGVLTGEAMAGGPDRAVAGHLRLALPSLAAVLGQPIDGAAQIDITASGTEERPLLRIDGIADGLKMGPSGAERAESHIELSWPERQNERIEIAARGAVTGIAAPAAAATIDRGLTWSMAAKAAPDGSNAELTQLTVHGVGVDVEGSGRIAEMGRKLSGRLVLSIADLTPLTGLFGRASAGELRLTAVAEQQSPDLVTVTLDGSVNKLQSGISTADAMTGGTLAISGSGHRGADGIALLDALSLKSAGAELSASGRLDPQTRQLAATLDAAIASLQPFAKDMGGRLGGRLSAHVTAEGPLDQPQLQVRLDGSNLTAGTAALDSIRLDARIIDTTARPQASLTGEFRAGGLDGTLSLEAVLAAPADLTLDRLRVRAAGGAIAGDLRVNLVTLLTDGSLEASLPDLAPWSRLAGTPLAGRADLRAKLTQQRGQAVELTVNGGGLAFGGGSGRIAIGQLAANARIADALGTPSGSGQATLGGVTFGGGSIGKASLALDSAGPGRFGFRAEAAGTVHSPLTVALAGTAELTPPTGGFDLQLARLNGTFGADKFQLTQALRLSAHGGDLAMSGLALTYGNGRLSGDASRRGSALSLRLTGRDLDLATLGRLAGRHELGGTLALDANVGGSLAAPQGRFTLTGAGLRLALPNQRLPTLGLAFDGTWNGRELGFKGHIDGLKGAALNVSGSAPVVLTPSPLGISLPPQGRLAVRLQGSGELANIADLLPLGEDSLTGKFTLDGGVDGTLAAPAASGHLTISDGRYASFATGAVLTQLRADIGGDRDRVTLREFSAKDTGSGGLDAHGSVTLAGGAPSADLSATLQNFRILGRDEGVLTASGNVRITGPIASPKVVGQLTTGEGDLRIPDNLPASVTKLQIVEINSREAHPGQPPPRTPVRRIAGKRAVAKPAAAKPGGAKAVAEKGAAPAVPATLDIKISLPGKVFVRGRGLDSEWRGTFTVSGTSDAPKIVGGLEVVRGTFDILGKTFKVTQGKIAFDGAAALDPTLDIVAEVVSGDVVARILVSGSASAPKIAITSTPTMPQEQILSYVLFNRPNTQITASEGVQLAQAAATLAGGGPGVLDRLRGRVGLDRLVLGSSTGANTSSSLNPAAGGSNAGGTSVSGGKYLAEGVYVGATQGLTPQSSKVVVEVEIRPRVTIEGDFSQKGSTGLGLNYKYDY